MTEEDFRKYVLAIDRSDPTVVALAAHAMQLRKSLRAVVDDMDSCCGKDSHRDVTDPARALLGEK